MKVLSVNAGSSSLKFTAFEMPEEKTLISGYFERIGIGNSFYTIKINGEKKRIEKDIKTHIEAFELLVKELHENNIVRDLDEIKTIGHRIVHGGDTFSDSIIIDEFVLKTVEEYVPIAPLHNPPAIIGVNAAMKVVPNAIQVATFDTAFHQPMDEEHFRYAVPEKWYQDYKVRKYGMHGISYQYITSRMNELLLKQDTKLIVCHMGSGASVCAIKNGKCVTTSMGLTPNAGLIMGTRSGDIDSSIIPYIMKEANLTAEEVNNVLNKESGILGLTGKFSDMRDLKAEIELGDETCKLTMKMYARRIIDYIAKYYFELKGCDAIVFTAGVGENGFDERREILQELDFLGVKIDHQKNENTASFLKFQEGTITTEDSSITAFVVPTNEEIMIARNAYQKLV